MYILFNYFWATYWYVEMCKIVPIRGIKDQGLYILCRYTIRGKFSYILVLQYSNNW